MSDLEKMNLPETGSSDDALSSRRYESLMQDVSVKKLILQKKIPEEQLPGRVSAPGREDVRLPRRGRVLEDIRIGIFGG